MCARYWIELDDRELRDIVAEVQKKTQGSPEQLQIKLSGEVFPTDTVPVLLGEGGSVSATAMR